jgi:cystathionine beta-lyase family protein involved in aluminum resistance
MQATDFNLDPYLEWINAQEETLQPLFRAIETKEFTNQTRVLRAFQHHHIGEHHLHGTTGYGHDDMGREALEKVFADVMGAEAALVRPHIASGTHAITAALFGSLRPGDELLFITGHPYDTLEEVVGLRGENSGSLQEWGVHYRQVDLRDYATVADIPWQEWLSDRTKVIQIQRSRGYSWRDSIPVETIGEVIKAVKAIKSDITVFVDNCYGEFTETLEPCHVGADLIAGSLIKNPGGGVVPTGGYVCGREDLIERVACRVYAPGMGRSGGATLDFNRQAFQGFFMAPHTVAQSLKGATLAAHIFAAKGFQVSPQPNGHRTDIIQALRFEDREMLIAFCKGIQMASPVDSYVTPTPAKVAGYEDDVIMAAGTFAEGSSIELSADGPLRPPFVGYLQGGLSYAHCKLAMACVLAHMEQRKQK